MARNRICLRYVTNIVLVQHRVSRRYKAYASHRVSNPSRPKAQPLEHSESISDDICSNLKHYQWQGGLTAFKILSRLNVLQWMTIYRLNQQILLHTRAYIFGNIFLKTYNYPHFINIGSFTYFQSDDTRGCNNTICPLEDEQGTARNMLRIIM